MGGWFVKETAFSLQLHHSSLITLVHSCSSSADPSLFPHDSPLLALLSPETETSPLLPQDQHGHTALHHIMREEVVSRGLEEADTINHFKLVHSKPKRDPK
jgi:hypothetical protein